MMRSGIKTIKYPRTVKSLRDPSVIVAHFVERRAEVAAQDLLWRYDLGCEAHKLRYDLSDTNSQLLAETARGLNIDPNTLRCYARVAEVITTHEFAEYLGLRNRYGTPMTWSHVEELAKCRSAPARRRCAHEVISEDLSVRGLEKRVRTATTTEDGGPIDIAGLETD
jgi:hypothetical protein